MELSDLQAPLEVLDTMAKKHTRDDLVWYDVHDEPFRLFGFCDGGAERGDCFRRVPASVADATSERVSNLSRHTAGGRVRFETDSPVIAVACDLGHTNSYLPFMPVSGTSGFDIYRLEEDGTQSFVNPLMPPYDREFTQFISAAETGSTERHTYTVNFPLHDTVKTLYIGLQKGAALAAPAPYRNEAPVVFYGSSITMGCNTSRPGTSYESRISNAQNLNYTNLGFSGACRGEDAIVAYLATLNMSVFVCDFDYNAQSPEELAAALPKLYAAIRKSHPTVPFLFVSSPTKTMRKEFHGVVEAAFARAKEGGDKNVYLLRGEDMFADEDAVDVSTENIHMNDFGFYWMAKAIGNAIKPLL